MLQQPIDYSLDVANPFNAALKGYETGMAMESLNLQKQAQELDLQRQQELQKRTLSLVNNPNPTARDYTNLAMFLPEKEAASVRANFELLDKDTQAKDLRFGGQVMSALNAKSPDVAIKLLNERAQAERNSGREDQAKQYETLAEFVRIDPTSASAFMGLQIATLPGGDKTLDSAIKFQKAPVEIANIESQINERAQKLRIDQDRLTSEVQDKIANRQASGNKLEPDARKLINEATVSAVASEQSANRLLNLASRMEAEGGGYGAATKFSESLANLTGQQDEFTLMRQEYIRLRNTLAVKNLPPGPATDKDIELALQGFPNENSDTAILASFMRGMAKLQQYEATTKDAEAEWVNATGTLGKARKDIEIGGIQVPKGTSYVEFQRKFGEKRAEQLAQQQDQANVETRSYMRFAKPTQ